jgi:hypothetical protein
MSNFDLTSWRELLIEAFKEASDGWTEIESTTLSEEDLDKKFDSGFGGSEGIPFTVWTKTKVYFPIVYDGAEWVGWVSRNPDGKPTRHMGGE